MTIAVGRSTSSNPIPAKNPDRQFWHSPLNRTFRPQLVEKQLHLLGIGNLSPRKADLKGLQWRQFEGKARYCGKSMIEFNFFFLIVFAIKHLDKATNYTNVDGHRSFWNE